MKVELELPDWCDGPESWLYIMRGMELVAKREPGKPWIVKASRCSRCGQCCMSFKNDSERWPFHKNGNCEFIRQEGEEWICSLGCDRPWSCSVTIRPRNKATCTERFE